MHLHLSPTRPCFANESASSRMGWMYDFHLFVIVKLISGLAESKDLRIGVFSRPWNPFQGAFGTGQHPGINLKDLDIEIYV